MVFTLLPQGTLAKTVYSPATVVDTHPEAATTGETSLTIAAGEPTEITADSVMLHGSLTGADNTTVQVYFAYGLDETYGNTTEKLDMETNGDFFIRILNLTPDTTYHFAAKAISEATEVSSEDATFTTLTAAVEPEITLPVIDIVVTATDITTDAATLNGTLTDLGGAESVDVYFEYSTDTSYGIKTAVQTITVAGAFTAGIADLEPDTPYHYRAVAVNSAGETYSDDATFTTLSVETGPEITLPVIDTAVTAIDITADAATLNGTLTDLGGAEAVEVYFEYGTDTNYGNKTDIQKLTAAGAFSADISDLKSETIYHFRAKAVSSSGEVYSEDAVFTTLPGNEILENTSDRTIVRVDPDKDIEIESPDKKIKLKFPIGAVDNSVDVELIELPLPGSPGAQFVSRFSLNATNITTKEKVSKFNKQLELSFRYSAGDLAGLNVDSLQFYYFDEETKEWIILPGKNDKDEGVLTAETDHFSDYSAQANLLQSGPGRVMASQVDLHSGTANYSYPFELPPGPGGFQPKLEMTYNSGVADEMKFNQSVGSWVGIGWSLHLGRISYDDTSKLYYLDLNGGSYQLVTSDNINYRTNPEQYFKIVRNSPTGNTWEMRDKEGYYYRFGGTSDSEQYLYNGSTIYYRWDLSLFKDTNDNQAVITYTRDFQSNCVRSAYPSVLSYGNVQVIFTTSYDLNDPTDGILRSDNPRTGGTYYAPKVMENRRLNSMEIKIGSTSIRKYTFTYQTTSGSTGWAGIHKLLSITQIGADGSSALPSLTFSYQNLLTHRWEFDSYYQSWIVTVFSWPHLTQINSGYGGSISFAYAEIPNTNTQNYWSREVVATKTIASGIGSNQTWTYSYTGNPVYAGTKWDQLYRGFSQVRETDAAGNYIEHFYYTTKEVNGKDADKLTGREYKTQWYSNTGVKLRETNYTWSIVNTDQNYDTYLLKWDVDIVRTDAANDYFYFNGTGGSNSCVTKYNKYGVWAANYYHGTNVRDVSVDNQGNIYLVDGNRALYKYYSNGTQAWVQYGICDYSVGPKVAVSNDGLVYAVASSVSIKRLDTNGNILSTFSTSSGTPIDIVVDNQGYVYILTTYYDYYYYILYLRVEKHDANGTLIGSPWGSVGTGDGQFSNPVAIAVDDSGNIYISDNNTGEYRVQKFNSSGTYISKILMPMFSGGAQDITISNDNLYCNVFNSARIFTKNWTVHLDQVEETIGSKTSRIRYVYDSYGNVVTEYRDGDTSISTDDSAVYREYYPNTTANILSKVAREYVRDYQSNTVKEAKYYHDGNNTSYTTAPTKGNLTRVEQKKDASNSVSSYYTYDTYGNRLTEQDPRGNTTTTTYDSTYHTYPAAKTYPITGLTESYTYDPGTSNLLTSTDVNGQVTTYTYDTFKRLISVNKPLGQNPDITYDYPDWGTLGQQRIITKTFYDENDNTKYLWSADYFDGLGRVVQTQTNGESGYTIIAGTTEYDSCGQVAKQYVSQDIASTLSAYYTTGIANWKNTSYTYDGLGRVIEQVNADSTSVSNDYSTAWQNTITNERLIKKVYYYDAFHRLIQIDELDDSESLYAATTYTYDALGNLIDVCDADDNHTHMEYDMLSRKTAMTDPDMGSWSYEYDANGNLTSQTDANEQTITMVYDTLNRLTAKSGTGLSVSYTYDAYVSGSNYGKGKRTGMTDALGTTSYKYDARGRQTEEKRTVSSVNYTTSFAYDGADRNTTITYPTGEVVTQAYNGRGLPNTLSGATAGSLVTGTTYNALGLVTQITLGNTFKTTFGYYGTGGTYDTTGGYYGRLWEIKTLPQAGGTAVQDVKHTWDAGGNLATRQDVFTSETETFTYDFLDRLTGVSGPYTESFTYNAIGNILTKTGTSYTYGSSSHKHAVTAAGSTSYAYDANGNMTTRVSHTITWDVENRLIGVTGGASFVYDGDGIRVKKTESSQTILYINKYYEKNITTGVVTTNYYLGDKLIATRAGTTLTYVHQDALTGTSVTTNSSGTSTGSIKFFSFGQTRSGTVPIPQKFTGQRLDSTGLYYYGARYYDPSIGRFISADTLVPNTINPQDMNRYSYVLNNPLKYNDPTGHYWSNPFNTLKGMGMAVYNTVKAVKDMVVNPVQTAQYLVNAVSNAGTGGIAKSIANDYATKWSTEIGRGEIVGEIAIIAGTIGAGTIASSGSKAIDLSNAFNKEASMAYRYVSENEFNIIQKTGKIPNVDELGNPKDIFVTTNKFNTVTEAEDNLLIGSKNPLGAKPSPQYGIAFEQNSVNYNYASAWGNNGSVVTEMTTKQAIPYSYSWELNSSSCSSYYNYYYYYSYWGY